MTKFNPDHVLDKDGKPMIVGGQPLLHSMYDEFSSPGFLEKMREMAAAKTTDQAIKEAMKKK